MKTIAMGILSAALASTAAASVTFDAGTGVGFVGKGDVQTAFLWNNAGLQANASGVSFSYDVSTSYDVVCEWDTATKKKTIHHIVSHHRSTAVSSVVDVDMRKNSKGQITGFNLLGFGAVSETGTPVPAVGDACLGSTDNELDVGNGAVVTSVTVEMTAGGLFVSYGDTDVLLTPVL